MNLSTVDLYEELQKLQRKNPIEEVNDILKADIEREKEISERLKQKNESILPFVGELDESKIFSLEQIKKLCIQYRLRFLDSSFFKGEIPYEAIFKIKELENKHGQPLNDFKIIAPKKLFHLEDKDADPILLLNLGKDKYYFIHKWGGDVNILRKTLAFPLRNFMTMFWFLAAFSLLFSIAVPTPSTQVFLFLIVHTFIASCGIACMLVFSLRENFSNVEWDSKYL